MALRLAKAGYWGGDPHNVLTAQADLVVAVAEYEVFLSEYENAYVDLNRRKD